MNVALHKWLDAVEVRTDRVRKGRPEERKALVLELTQLLDRDLPVVIALARLALEANDDEDLTDVWLLKFDDAVARRA